MTSALRKCITGENAAIRRYIIAALAAVIVLVCGSVMTGVGSKSYWKVIWSKITGDGPTSITDVEDMKSHETEDIDEMGVYRKINESFGVSVVRLGYKPKGMSLGRYTLDEEQRKAYIFYDYYGEVIRYGIYMNDTDSSFGQKELDKLTDQYEINNNGVKIKIEEFYIDDTENKRYIAEFKNRDICYQLKGAMSRSEFNEIIKNLIIF